MIKKPIEQLTVGSVILPPARELSLWMRRHCAEHGLSEAALNLTVRETYEGKPDSKGRWIVVKCDQSPEWAAGRSNISFNFKARPSTLWSVIQ